MDLIGGLWHVLNFFSAAAGVSLFASLLAKLFWRSALASVAWWRLWSWSGSLAAMVVVAGLIFFGRDGKMATYGAMVLACALGLWWTGFGPGRR